MGQAGPPEPASEPAETSVDFRARLQTIGQRLTRVATEERVPVKLDGGDLARYLSRFFRPQGYEVLTLSGLPTQDQSNGARNAPQGSGDDITVIQIQEKAIDYGSESRPRESIALRVHTRGGQTVLSLGRTRGQVKDAANADGVSRMIQGRLFRPAYGYLGHRLLASKIWSAINEYVRTVGEMPESAGVITRIHALDENRSFFDRLEEIEGFKTVLENTLRGYPEHLAVMGDPGIGKSSLLRKLEEIATQRGCLVVRRELDFSFNSVSDLGSFLADAFQSESLSKLPRGKRLSVDIAKFFDSHGVSITAFGTGVGIFAPGQRSVEAMQERLAKLFQGVARKLLGRGIRGVVFLLDDADRLDRIDGSWEFLRKIYTRVNEDPGSRIMLVVSGSRLFARHGADFPTTRRFFRTVELGPFDYETSLSFLREFTSGSGVPSNVLQSAAKLSGGHPLILHTFASEILEQATVEHGLSKVKLSKILPGVEKRLAEGFFWDRSEDLTDEEKSVLVVLSKFKKPARASEVGFHLKTEQQTTAEVFRVLSTLRQKGSLRTSSDGGFALFCPLFGDYIRENFQFASSHPGRRRKS